jgi:hypothetical protein
MTFYTCTCSTFIHVHVVLMVDNTCITNHNYTTHSSGKYQTPIHINDDRSL